MPSRIKMFNAFVGTFVKYAMHIREVIGALIVSIVIGGFAISKLEGISLGDAIYFAFITGMSIGYGDIVPHTTAGKVVSVAIGLVGMLFVGVTVAIATRALADTAKRYLDANE
jgi:voltage-gated potassium channel